MSSETDEETVILSASIVDGSLCQLGSQFVSIVFQAEQLSSETDEETVILSASIVDGSLCQLGSQFVSIVFQAEQLSSETDEETVILSASTVDGALCQLGSRYGKNFLQDKDDIQSQFSRHCLHSEYLFLTDVFHLKYLITCL